MKTIIFEDKEMRILASKDIKMAKVIAEIGIINREYSDDIFSALIESIISQQLSGKVAEIINDRFNKLMGNCSAERIHNMSIDEIRSVGLSERKASYIKGVAEAVVSGNLDIEALRSMSDREVIDELVKLKGIGQWTAEMMLIFALGRKDILSINDLGIRRGIEYLYYDSVIDYEEIRARYSPLNTLASFYLWEIASRGLDWVKKLLNS